MKEIVALMAVVALMFSCKNEDKTKSIEKDGSVEIVLSVTHLNDSYDILTSYQTTWVKNVAVRKAVSIDTLPSLGDTVEDAEDNDGNDTTVVVPKNYQLFITVK